jgi:hypothetical protein
VSSKVIVAHSPVYDRGNVVPCMIVAAVTLMASAAQAQTPQQPSPQKGIENLRAAHTSCVERTFHLSDTNPATVERAFAACQTEEQAYLSAVALVMHIPPGFVGANSADAATLEARSIVDRHKLNLKWRLLNDAAKLQRNP